MRGEVDGYRLEVYVHLYECICMCSVYVHVHVHVLAEPHNQIAQHCAYIFPPACAPPPHMHTNTHARTRMLQVYSPSRTVQVFARVEN